MKNTARVEKEKLPTSVPELVALFPPIVLQSRRDFCAAQRVVDALAVRKRLTSAQSRYLATLTLLMDEYEKQFEEELSFDGDGVDVLGVLLEQHGLSGRALGELLGQPQLGGKILRRERELSKAHIRKLSEYFGVSADVFLRA